MGLGAGPYSEKQVIFTGTAHSRASAIHLRIALSEAERELTVLFRTDNWAWEESDGDVMATFSANLSIVHY